MKFISLGILLTLLLFAVAEAKIIAQKNEDGTITYTNVHEVAPEPKREESGIGDIIEGVKVLNITTKVVDSSQYYIDVSVRLKVKNNTNSDEISIKIEGIDSANFQRYYTYINGRVPPGRTGYISEVCYVDRAAFAGIKKWQVK